MKIERKEMPVQFRFAVKEFCCLRAEKLLCTDYTGDVVFQGTGIKVNFCPWCATPVNKLWEDEQ